MIKKVSILIVVVVLALLVAPYAVGMFTQSRLNDRIEYYDSNPAIAASVDSYERGWRSSRVVLHYGPSDTYLQQLQAIYPLAMMLQGFSVPFIVEVEHGPVLLDEGFGLGTARIRAFVDPDWQFAQMAQQFLSMPYLFELRGQSGFGGGFDFEGEIPPFDGALADLSYNFSGLNFTGHMQGNETSVDSLLENASLQSSEISAVLESLSMSADSVIEPDRMPLGSGRISIARVAATNPMQGATPLFLASNMAMDSSVTEAGDGETLAFDFVYSADSLAMTDLATITNWAIGMSASNLDAEAMHSYYAIASDPAISSDPEAAQAALLPVLDAIVAGSPELSIEPVRFSMPSGDFDGQLTVTVEGSALPTGRAMDLQNMAVLMGAIDAELTATATKALARELAAMIVEQQISAQAMQMGQSLTAEELEEMATPQADLLLTVFAAQGLFIDDGEAYSTLIEFRDGNATANGRPIPLGGF